MIRMIHTTASIKYTQPEQSQIDENENEKKNTTTITTTTAILKDRMDMPA